MGKMDVNSAVVSASSSASVSSTSSSKADTAVGVTLVIGLPLIVIIVTAVVVLLLVLAWLYYKSRQNQKISSLVGGYKPIGMEDSGTAAPLPYPPAVKLGEPPVPAMSFVMATQLSPSKSASRDRYPFSVHKSSTSEKQPLEERRPPRLRTKRRGNHKHGNGRHVVLPSGDLSSDSSEKTSSDKGGASLTSGETYMTPLSPSKLTTKTAESGEVSKIPEISLQMIYREDTASLIVKIDKVVSLPLREDGSAVEAYVRLFFKAKLPDLPQRRTSKTRTQRKETAPVFDEEIRYEAMSTDELINSTLHIEVLDYRSYGKHLVLGQADLSLAQVQFEKGEASLSLYLHPPKLSENLGTVLISLSYSPDTRKLSVIILRAKDLNRGNAKETDAQIKIWITLGGDKILAKHKTKKKPQSSSPIFNEALTCIAEPGQMKSVAVNVSMTNENRLATRREMGQVILCSQSSGEEFRHWNDVIATPGKHIAEWHELR